MQEHGDAGDDTESGNVRVYRQRYILVSGEKMSLKSELDGIHGEIVIYGAHLIALECCRFLVDSGKGNQIVGFAVTDKHENPDELEGFQVKEISEYAGRCQTCTVIIAMPEKYHEAVESHARSKGFWNFIKVNLEKMSVIKGRQLIVELQENFGCSFILEKNANDSSWLDIREKGDKKNRTYKFPTLFYKTITEVLEEAGKISLQEKYHEILGTYRNLHVISDGVWDTAEPASDIMKIYMGFSRRDSAKAAVDVYDSWICPLQLGERDPERNIFCLYDDVGESISDKNSIFAEMTGAYWIWKNISSTAYKGLCHYRRHFIITENEIKALERNGFDVILTTPRYVPYGVGNMFLAETPVKKRVYEAMHQAVGECAPEDSENFESYMKSCFYYPNNMVIARNDIYNAYCEWIFRILFRMLDIDLETGYGHGADRHIAYAAELLTSFYFAKNKDNYRIAVTDYRFYS